MVELVAVLYQQHLAGRKIIVAINALNTETNLQNPLQRPRVAELLNDFNRIFRPHAAWRIPCCSRPSPR